MATTRYRKAITLPDGTRKYISGKTQQELDRKINELNLQLNLGIDIGDNTTVEELAQMWINVYKRPVLKANSLQTVLDTVNTYIMPKIGHMLVKDVRPMNIQMIMAGLNGYSQSTQSKVLKALKNIFDVAVDNNMVVRSPVTSNIKARGVPTAEKVPLTKQQSDELLAFVKGSRAEMMVMLMLEAGLRREEALGLMWSDIDFDRHLLTVNRADVFLNGGDIEMRTQLKSAAAHRSIPMTLTLENYLRDQIGHRRSLYLVCSADGSPLNESSFSWQWRLISEGTKTGQLSFHVHPHLLRHTCITRWASSGKFDLKTVQYLAGHSTPQMTLSVYAHYERDSRLSETTEKMRAVN